MQAMTIAGHRIALVKYKEFIQRAKGLTGRHLNIAPKVDPRYVGLLCRRAHICNSDDGNNHHNDRQGEDGH